MSETKATRVGRYTAPLLLPERVAGEGIRAVEPHAQRWNVAQAKSEALALKLVRSSLEDATFIDALSQRIQALQERRRRLLRRVERRREIALRIMRAFEVRRIEAADVTVVGRTGAPRLDVTEEAAIPGHYWLSQPPKLDRPALLRALKAGECVPGAVLAPCQVELHVRTR